MKVKELIEILSKYEPTSNVYIDVMAWDEPLGLTDIDKIQVIEAEKPVEVNPQFVMLVPSTKDATRLDQMGN